MLSLFTRLFTRAMQALDQSVGWYRVLLPIALVTLIGLRIILRQRNLTSTYTAKSPYPPAPPPEGGSRHYLTARTADGAFNDLDIPAMGSANTRFGRNIPLQYAYPDNDAEILRPNPRTVSLELLARDTFKPVPFLNLLAAAWIQFMIHDWFSHGKGQKENPWQVPLSDDDPWPDHPMTILRTPADSSRTPGYNDLPPTFINTVTHWWDGSQLYGSDKKTQDKVRSHKDGKLTIGADGLLPAGEDGIEITALNGNWWIGLSLMHTLFTLEHNAICDRLRSEYPSWSDDDLFDRARLVNVALMAKIHTVDWTPSILNNPTLDIGMHANWWGLAGEQIYKLLGRVSKSEVISGIPGSEKDHFGVPYSLTEEFVSVYRMHPLLPDDFSFRSAEDDRVLQEPKLAEVADRHARELLQQMSMPRYNEFRKLMHRPPVASFEELTDNKEWAEQLRRIYDNDINKVDVMVGMYAETPPPGFGFSDTAFRIFILMASRRLNSDRFFTTDFTPTVYTPAGFNWIVNNNMSTVLLRHFPALAATLRDVKNAFAPWPTAKA